MLQADRQYLTGHQPMKIKNTPAKLTSSLIQKQTIISKFTILLPNAIATPATCKTPTDGSAAYLD